MTRAPTAVTLPFFYLLIVPALLFNLIAPIYPLVIEGIIIGDKGISTTRLDLWVASQSFGGFNRDGYVSFLLELYGLSALVGGLVAYLTLGSIFRRLLAKNEATFGDFTMAFRVVGDWFVALIFFLLLFDTTLAYFTGYPGSLGGISAITVYSFSGFITGGTIIKTILPLRVQLKNRRENLIMKSEFVERSGENSARRKVRWTLQKKQTL